MAEPKGKNRIPDLSKYDPPVGKDMKAIHAREQIKNDLDNQHDIQVIQSVTATAREIDDLEITDDEKITLLLQHTRFNRVTQMVELSLTDKTSVGLRALERLQDMESGGKMPNRRTDTEEEDKLPAVSLDF